MSEPARVAFDQHDWTEARRLLTEADPTTLDGADLERLAVAAYLVGDDEGCHHAYEAAHTQFLAHDEPADAARCAVWLALTLLLSGETARGGGWMARAERVLDDGEVDCSARGFLLVPAFLRARASGDIARSVELSAAIADIARRFDDADLAAFATLSQGQAALSSGDHATGLTLLDEAMVGVQADQVSPIPTGIIYCAVIESCMRVHDLSRAAEWTEALSSWCEAQPGLVPFRGQCTVHRSQVLCHRGRWPRALDEARRAVELLAEPPHPALGLAHYQQGEVRRRQGSHDDAAMAYRAASLHGHDPEPGLALVQLARGRPAEAAAMIRSAVDRPSDLGSLPLCLAASVEIHHALGDTTSARESTDRLAELASAVGSPYLLALTDHASSVVLLAEGVPGDALVAARSAAARWDDLGAPYEQARARTVAGLALAALGDRVSADLELDAARHVFVELGAAADVERVDAVRIDARSAPSGPLTAREVEVLRAVAAGRTNKEIATELTISDHTVSRHLGNIFTKIDVRSRAAATAYAYEHGLI